MEPPPALSVKSKVGPSRQAAQALLLAAEQLNSAGDPDQVLRCLVEVTARALSVERVAVATNEGDHALRRYTWDVGASTSWSLRLPLDGSISGWIIRSGRAYLSDDLDGPPVLNGAFRFKDVLAVPIRARDGRVLAALNLHERRDGHPFSRDDQHLAETIAGYAAAALERGMLVAELCRSAEGFRRLVDTAFSMTIVLDADGIVRYASANLERTLGMRPEDLLGTPLLALVHPDDVDRALAALQCLESVGSAVRIELRVRGPDDSWRYLEVAATNLLHEASVNGIVVTACDISERMRREQEREERVHALEAKSAEQDRFVHTVAHALKAPLASVVAMTEVLGDELPDLGEEMQYSLELIHRNVRRMRGIVDDLLRLARSDAGVNDIETVPVELESVLEAVQHELASHLAERSVRLRIARPLPSVLGQAGRLVEVFSNLVDNAIRYTPPERSPEVRVGARLLDGFVECWVADNGIGIPVDERERVFQLFHRLESGRVLNGTGSGVGLAMAAQIVRQHGGEIWIDDRPALGTCFRFTLPAAPVRPHQTAAGEQSA